MLFHRIKQSFKACYETFRHGGYKQCNISYITDGNRLKDKRILITGGASGIGYAIVKQCLKEGADVVITGRNEDKLQTACQNNGDNSHLKYIVWDISKTSLNEDNINRVVNLLGADIDILVNNAGVQPYEFFPNVTESEWNRIYETNSKGTFFLSQSIAKHWRKNKVNYLRKIINISSQGGFVGATYPYRMSKWDIAGLTEGLAKTLIKDEIIVNGIAPGVIKTAMQSKFMAQGDNVYCVQNPSERYAFPEEIAELAVWLMSDLSNFIVGQTILCDGGFTLK